MVRRRASSLLSWMLCTALVGLAAPFVVAEEEKKVEQAKASEATRPAEKGDVIVITNEYLEKRFGGEEDEAGEATARTDAATPATAGAGSEKAGTKTTSTQPVDPLAWMANRKAAQAEWQRQVSEAEAEVAEARKKVADLEYRLRATRIPFLARPEIPEDEREEWKSQSASERAATTQSQLDSARTELDAATQKLERLNGQRP